MSRSNSNSFDLDAALDELAHLIAGAVARGQALGDFDAHIRMGPLWALRANRPTAPSHAIYTPMLCVMAQGAKQITLGAQALVYNRGRFLLNSVALPASGQVIEATPHCPCLWIMLELDAATIASVIVESGLMIPAGGAPLPAMETPAIGADLLGAVVRWARLLEAPDDAKFLAPLLMREIVYRLLQTDQAPRLRQIAAGGGQTQRVLSAIEWVRCNFDKPLKLEELARQSGMSLSALHHHFKDVTGLSPLQFGKQMRLQEAKRLMLRGDLDAAGAGGRVGYDDPSHFSRDYRRFFGAPPRRHIAGLKNAVA